MRFILIYLLISVYYFPIKLHGQDDYIVNQAKFLQKTNASFYGMNQLNRVGVLYNSIKVNEQLAMDNKYVFGSIAFQDKNFSLGFDVNSFKLNDLGMTTSMAYLTYVYKIQISNYTFFLPGISVGMISSRINTDNLIFGDQLSMATGFIAAETQDRLAPMISNASDFDLGASFIIHNEFFMAGLSLKHLRKPNVSYNKETLENKPIRIGVQGAYEFNINPFERSFLPRFSYLYTFLNYVKYGKSTYIGLSEEFQFGEFAIGFTQQASMVPSIQGGVESQSFSLNNIGITLGLALENFDFGINYNFANRKPGKVFAPSIFELSIIFDFSIYRRNNRGIYKKLQIDNYY
tara:strand:+ start:157 stop:1197 length:1041 start_codon:yes stop_codon:yes gene_type:complete